MKNITFCIFLVYGVSVNSTAQSVGIGTTTPNASALLEIKSNTKGLLMPVMTSANRIAISNPAKGLLVYDSTEKSFYFYDGSIWLSQKTAKLLADDDGNTTVEVERTANDNIIRLRNGGSDHTWFMKNSTNAYNLIHYPLLPTDNFLIGTNTGWKLKAGIGGNVFMGVRAGFNDSTGTNNTLIGNDAGYGIFTGSKNIAIGNNAGLNLKDGSNNVNIGLDAGWGSKNNTNSVHIGFLSGYYDSLTNNNIGIGNSSLYSNQGNNNIAIGHNSLKNTTTSGNIAIGVGTLEVNNSFFGNSGAGLVAIGDSALHNNQYALGWIPDNNTAIGYKSLLKNRDGYENTALGAKSLINNFDGGQNVAVGSGALSVNVGGTGNTAIGYNANVASESLFNATAIGVNALVSTSRSMVLGNNAKVGIGTSSPTSTLDIVKTTGAVAALTINGTENSTNYNFGTNEDIYIRPGKTAGIVKINDESNSMTRIGGVNGGILSKTGINTSNPQSALDVLGDVTITDIGALGGGLYSTKTSNPQNGAPGLNMVPIGIVSYSASVFSNGSGTIPSSYTNLVGNFVTLSNGFYDDNSSSSVSSDLIQINLVVDPVIYNSYSKVVAMNSPNFDFSGTSSDGYCVSQTSSFVIIGATRIFRFAARADDFVNVGPFEKASISGTVIFYGIK